MSPKSKLPIFQTTTVYENITTPKQYIVQLVDKTIADKRLQELEDLLKRVISQYDDDGDCSKDDDETLIQDIKTTIS